MKLIRSAALVIGTVAGLMVPAATAQADVYVGYDPTKDVKLAPDVPDDEGNGGFFLGAADRVLGDITQIRVAHTAQKVRISMTYRALAAAGNGTLHEFTVGSSKGGALVSISGVPGHWLGKPTFYRDGKLTCADVVGRIDYTNDRVIVEFPRSCLSNPTWVQVAGKVEVSARGFGIYTDWSTTWGYRPVFTPRVRL